ncbi:MAG: VCBS repeat-containing protein [Victivallales bacterium]|nr:VCBS repeat-containing protein [Victivallales bacterium]
MPRRNLLIWTILLCGGVASAAAPEEPVELTKLKKLCLTTPLVEAVIAPGDDPTLKKAAAKLAAEFGAEVVDATSVELPLSRHVIAIGNRVNNPFINHLYRRGFCYTDLVYPGSGGHELRSIHNPTGEGFNVILCGGSDERGAVEAAELLAQEPPVVGHLMKLKVPGFKEAFDAYDPDHYYLVGKGGYYGWNYLSGMLALFYQTGNAFYAKEFLRLAFPDAKAKKDFQKYNPESIELPDDPLAGPYHYCASQMILLWDLVEEHPVFSDEERLRVTNGFARQWKHHFRWTRPAGSSRLTSSRHGQWASISMYVLGRYFNRDYPAPVWADAMRRAEADFANSNSTDGWIEGERGIVAWFVSGAINPTAQFSALTEMEYNSDGAFANALRFMETQWDGSGRSEIFSTAHRQAFYLISEHTGDGKYIWYADLLPPYPKDAFKLGASFSPTGKIAKRAPTELLNTWTVAPMKEAEHRFFGLKEPLEKCCLGLAWRDTLDTTGDWISFNCFNESYRTSFKLLSLNGLRLDGQGLLSGFGNYVQITRGGTVDREIPTVGQIYNYGQAGASVFMSGGVPNHSFGAWKRSLLLRNRSFVLLADTVTPFEEGDDLTVLINYQSKEPFALVGDGTPRAKITSSSGRPALVRDMQKSTKPEHQISWGPRNTLFHTEKVGDRAIIGFNVEKTVTCNPVLMLYDHNTRAGTVDILLDGKRILTGIQHYSPESDLQAHHLPLGRVTLSSGSHTLEIEVMSLHPSATAAYIGAGTFTLNGGALGNTFYLTASAGNLVRRTSSDTLLKRRIKSDPKRPVTTFTLFNRNRELAERSAFAVNDNAAIFPSEPMLAFCGDWERIGQGDFVVLESDSIAGSGVTKLAGSFTTKTPVMIDWHFGKSLAVSGEPGTDCIVNGQPYKLDGAGQLVVDEVMPRDYEIWRLILKSYDNISAQEREPADPQTKLARGTLSCKLVDVAEFEEEVSFVTPCKGGYLVGMGKELLVLDTDYRIKVRCQLNDLVQCATTDGQLFFAGCKNEEIAAFDITGKKLWSFTSQLAPEVEKTQKYYWFKGAYPGVFSLAVHNGKLYAGSACTMEVVDFSGNFVARYPQTWGCCRQICFIDQEDGSNNTVGLRNKGTDGTYMWTVNSRTGKNTVNYRDNMPGYRNFPSFGSLYRTRAFVDDFDGDGVPELLADAQGMYTWFNLYHANGTPERQVNLGPGRVICDWTVGDFTGDVRPEIAVITYTDELLAIDGQCVPLWNVDVPFHPSLLAIDAIGKRIVVADKRSLVVFDGNGTQKHFSRLPDCITHLWCNGGGIYVVCGKKILQMDY